ncbi:MAG: T9SS type A sorting domain-containing protein [Bacteroidetes bacterium]|nr:T9SS type A sorting domain-containing protein [Bacteroidota bacterium]
MRSLGLVVFLFYCGTMTALAQDRSDALMALPLSSRSAVVTENAWVDIPTVDIANGRMDKELEILRAAYQLYPTITAHSTPEATVRAWLEHDGPEFGIHFPEHLELIHQTETVGAHHLTFQQTLGGVKVYERYLHVNLDSSGLPVMATSSYEPHLEDVGLFDSNPSITASQAESIAQDAISPEDATSTPAELLVLPDHPPRLIWRVIVWPDADPSEWEVLLDAQSGTLIQLMDQRIFSHDDSSSKVDGEGSIWLYDPLTASGQPYGGDLTDNNDLDNPTLNNLLTNVTLQDIEQRSDGSYRLNGPWIRITGSTPPVESDPSAFKYTRSDDRFEAVMVYYFIDESQRYIQSLNTGDSPPRRPITANPHASTDDNSWFTPLRNSLSFGDGGVDDAEDVGVILHEYGHAIMYYRVRGVWRAREQLVLAEGFADYWAVSYRKHLMDTGMVPQRDWRQVFPWDGVAWGGRRADGDHHYSEIQRECRGRCNFYTYGTTWAALMMRLQERINRTNADRLHLAGFSYLGSNFTARDMVIALLKADKAMYNGEFANDIMEVFSPNGFVDAQYGIPQISHTPPRHLQDNTEFIQIQATIQAPGIEISNAEVLYRFDKGEFQSLSLTNLGNMLWSAEIDLPPSSSLLEYYIQASTSVSTNTLPPSAPDNFWSVGIGPDQVAPTISYSPVTHLSIQDATQPISILITDNVGVTQASIEYVVTSSEDLNISSGTFSLVRSGNDFFTFTLSQLDISEGALPGTKMEYRIIASDSGDPPNVASFPSEDAPLLRLDVLPGTNELGIWHPREEDPLVQGEWGISRDDLGHSGPFWSTTSGIAYTDQSSLSFLTFADVNVVGYSDAQLEFWHWYDFENIDVPGPGESGGVIHDGGQIQMSVNGGQSWFIATPQWGYNGNVIMSQSNPIEGTPAYGGSSFGWRRVRVPLPDAPAGAYRLDISTRLAFGTGSGNSHETTNGYAGWAVRDARVLIQPPVDTSPPEVLYSPYVNQFISPNQNAFPVRVSASDDPGIESVRLHLLNSTDSPSDGIQTYRLRPMGFNSDWYRVHLPVDAIPSSQTVEYYITIRDFDANQLTLGEPSQDTPYFFHISSETPLPALTNARLSGAWSNVNETFSAQTDVHSGLSSIVLPPAFFSGSSDQTMLRLRHAYNLGNGSRGRVSISTDGGDSWGVLTTDRDPAHTTQAQRSSFSGEMREPIDSWFDLSSKRQPYQIRLDLIHGAQKVDGDYWEVLEAQYYRLTNDQRPEPISTEVVLYPNFPNPFLGETTISYVIPEQMNVHISLFNALGQSIQTITNQRVEAGGYAFHLNLNGLAPGIYWVRMNAGNSLYQQPIMLLR